MEDKDYIEQLFSTKLKNAEVPVSPEVWTKISAGIQTTGAVSTGVSAGFLKGKLMWIAGTIIGVVGVGTAIYFSQPKEETNQSAKNKTVNQKEKLSPIIEESNTIEKPLELSLNTEEKSIPVEQNQVSVEKIEDEIVINEEFTTVQKDLTSEEKEEIVMLPTRNPSSIINKSAKKQEIDNTLQSLPVIENSDEENEVIQQIEEKETKEIILPNAFSPNQDGVEDIFFIQNLSNISDFQVVILNAKNQVVYSSNDINFNWDGRNQSGEWVEKGTYVYFLTGINSDGSKFNKASQLRVYR